MQKAVDPLDPRVARAAALDALARRDRSSEDLRRKLLNTGYDAALVDTVIERLRTERLIDDRRYVENFIAIRASRGQGPVRVRMDLQRAGLDHALIEEIIDAFADWISTLRQAREKKFGTQPPTDYADRWRQTRFLMSRGFTGAQIRMAVGFDADIDEHT